MLTFNCQRMAFNSYHAPTLGLSDTIRYLLCTSRVRWGNIRNVLDAYAIELRVFGRSVLENPLPSRCVSDVRVLVSCEEWTYVCCVLGLLNFCSLTFGFNWLKNQNDGELAGEIIIQQWRWIEILIISEEANGSYVASSVQYSQDELSDDPR